MTTRTFALVLGVAFIVAGLAGFFPTPADPPAGLTQTHGFGHALSVLPVNTLHNIVHIVFGLMGILASRGTLMSARGYAQFVAVAYGLLVVLGLLPQTNTTFGLIPLYGADVWLHAIIAAAAAYFGFVAREPVAVRMRA
jgi:hypothetical protein